MPDPFFVAHKGQKRKRKSVETPGSSSRKLQKTGKTQKSKPATKRRDVERDSDDTGDEGGIDDLDLRHTYSDGNDSGEEVEHETPAEKRLRLAKIYLESLQKEIGMSRRVFNLII